MISPTPIALTPLCLGSDWVKITQFLPTDLVEDPVQQEHGFLRGASKAETRVFHQTIF
jgi:hypothetical protein